MLTPKASKPTQTLRVLLVDDQVQVFNMVNEFMSIASFAMVTMFYCGNSEEAIRRLTTEAFDLCLIDYEIDTRTGLDVIRSVSASGSSIPFILLTGHGSYKLDVEAMQAGVVDYLDKVQLRADTLERVIRYNVERVRILAAEREQRDFAQALLDISNVLNSTLHLEEVLERILNKLSSVIPHDTANIMLIENGYTHVVGLKGYDETAASQQIAQSRFSVTEIATFAWMMQHRQPMIVEDIFNVSGWLKSLQPHQLRGYIGAPIFGGEQVIGFINLESYTPGFFQEFHAQRLQIFAGQAALAIQNASTYQRAREHATMQERQRLAADLHDAVSQTLFSSSVIAEALPRLVESNPAELLSGLDRLAKLTRGALAEMRSMLMELRPTALIETDLAVLVQQLKNGFQSRTEGVIEIVIEGSEQQANPPQEVHVALYRIAQEALNNVIKHARATHIEVFLAFTPASILLEIRDNGRGFDLSEAAPDRMGLRIMRERVESAGLSLAIESQKDQGTIVTATWGIEAAR